jgi:hypothetical protein
MERIIDTGYNVSSGYIFEVRNNGVLKFAVAWDGAVLGTSFTYANLTLSGNLQVDGNTIIGNAVGDTLTVNATPTFKEITTFEKAITAQAALGISGVITSSNTTSTNISTASIATAGGIGVAKDVFVGEDLNVVGATTLNTLSTSGNTSIAGNLEVLGTTTLKNVVRVESRELDVDDASITLGNVVAINGFSGTVSASSTSYDITGITHATNNPPTSGLIPGMALVATSGSLGINPIITAILSDNSISVTSDSSATAGSVGFNSGGATDFTANGGGFTIKGLTDKTFLWDKTADKLVSSEGIKISDTTSSTNTTTGAEVIAGGLGVAENINAGGYIKSVGKLSTDNNTQATNASDGSINTPGGISCAKDIYCGGNLVGPEDTTAIDLPLNEPDVSGTVWVEKWGRVVTLRLNNITKAASGDLLASNLAAEYRPPIQTLFPTHNSTSGGGDGTSYFQVDIDGRLSCYNDVTGAYGVVTYIVPV